MIAEEAAKTMVSFNVVLAAGDNCCNIVCSSVFMNFHYRAHAILR